MQEQDRRLEGFKEIGAAFTRPVHERTARRYRKRGLEVHRSFGGRAWTMLSCVRAFESRNDLAV